MSDWFDAFVDAAVVAAFLAFLCVAAGIFTGAL